MPLVVPDGCALSADELAAQAGRGARLSGSIVKLRRSEDELRVFFGPGVDAALVDEVIETERGCCSFLRVEYDADERLLRIGADDEQGREVVGRLAGFFGEGR